MRTGRPRQFDRAQAVISAMHLFWQNGYDATSLSQLKAAIGGGITAPSFYAAFGSKEALFREAADCYLNTYAQVTEPLWDSELPPRQALETVLMRSTQMQYGTDHPRGCMVALGAMSCTPQEHRHILAPLTASRQRTLAGMRRCISEGIRRGELRDEPATLSLAVSFDSFLLGVSVLAIDDVPLQEVEDSVRQIMTLWDHARVSELSAG